MDIGVFMKRAINTGVTLVVSAIMVGSFSGCSGSAATPAPPTTSTAPTVANEEDSSVLADASFGDIRNNTVTSTKKTIIEVEPVTRTKPTAKVTVKRQTQTTRTIASNTNRAPSRASSASTNAAEEKWLEYQRKWEAAREQRQQAYASQQNRQQYAQVRAAPRRQAQPQRQAYARQVQQANWNDAPQAQPRQQAVQIAMAPVIDPGRLANAAIARLRSNVTYNGTYMPIRYPNGDVPPNIGVCSDVVIRSYRQLGIDLQRLVHEDMTYNFNAYPNLSKWGLSAPDTNIDHRRVHNLKAFFTRYGQRLPVTSNPANYLPGDIVTWYLGGDQEHIGIVVNRYSEVDPQRPLIVHHLDQRGVQIEDMLFSFPISGHYRYVGGTGTTQMVAM